MTVALQAIRAIIDRSSRSTVRQLSEELFHGDVELRAYRFFTSFYTRFGEMPSVEVMRENGFNLPPANAPLNYFLERLRYRSIYATVQQALPEIDQAIQERNFEQVAELWGAANRDIRTFSGGEDVVLLPELMQEVMAEAQRMRLQGSAEVTGVTLGWPTADTLTAGAQPGDVISVVARPNVGKSWTLIHMAKEAWMAGHSVVFLTMEMTAHQIARRTLSLSTGVNPDHIRRGRISMWGEDILHDFIEQTDTMPAFHLMSGSFRKTTTDFDRVVQEFNPDIGYIDASYLVSPEKKQRMNGARWERVYDVGEEIKAIAQDRDKPIVQTLQLNREAKKGAEFDMNQIAGGDVIGQISSGVVFVGHGEGEHEEDQRRYELGKNREGRLGKWTSNFLFNPMDFSERPPEDREETLARLRGAI